MTFRVRVPLPLTIWELEEFIEGIRLDKWPTQQHIEITFDVEDRFLVATIEPKQATSNQGEST